MVWSKILHSHAHLTAKFKPPRTMISEVAEPNILHHKILEILDAAGLSSYFKSWHFAVFVPFLRSLPSSFTLPFHEIPTREYSLLGLKLEKIRNV